ncbi:error-prone DNA polymerase [Aquabacterium sp.]|uniref:error-prone DNA polymerase n=1 Tax=Aquabacterium sp. TaxID=1872578 RepID=UPI00248930B9|nr:error-prone DNA polymerase [Aquabacterium sp.]MDI1259074.1 error-prone DNA polymerase [Aquabacterium sp.]
MTTSRPSRAALPAYAELHCVSNFSFLRGAAHPGELVDRALALGYTALALTDDCSVAGVVRAHLALRKAREQALADGNDPPDFKLIIGSEFTVEAEPDFKLVLLARRREGYAQLCEFITRLRRATPGKGTDTLRLPDIQASNLKDCLILMVPHRRTAWPQLLQQAQWLQTHFAGRCWLAVELLNALDDAWWLRCLRDLGHQSGVPLLASGDVHMHVRSRKPLQDVLTATRLGKSLPDCGLGLQGHAEQHLRSRLRLARRYPADLLATTQEVVAQCHFSLDELSYEYPEEIVPAGETAASHLRQLTQEGGLGRFPKGIPNEVTDQIEKELALISELGFEQYFLTVHDIVSFARSRNILCQGRGSAANSTVCYCLGITEIDPARNTLLFERFISRERNEPPDIDVDFEHQRREEVIQYLYGKYGRDRTALTATVITYRTRSALRDVGKALGISAEVIERVAENHQWWDGRGIDPQRLLELGIEPTERRIQQWQELTCILVGFPRHLSQHTGGFVIARTSLCQLVPIENATMPDRSVIQWDKDDLDALRMLKVDVLALGMLSALRRALDFISIRRGHTFALQDIPDKDTATFDMICQADTIGVFQIESRAQMNMLPQLQPRTFYDLVVEVALVRPGPIQGGMVKPYLLRRSGQEANDCPELLKPALGRTHGIPIFQEQVMQVVMIAAGFTAGEADDLRRSMAAWKRHGSVDQFHQRITEGMTRKGYTAEFAERIFQQIEGFGAYGFPESHSASFALLVYDSAWIKCHEPAIFLAALLNAQPLGFYSPSQLVQDAARHGVMVFPPDVVHSDLDCTLVDLTDRSRQPSARLGLSMVSGLSSQAATRIIEARRGGGPFQNVEELSRRAQLDQADMRHLAAADALISLAGHRRQQVWEASALHRAPALLREAPVHEDLLTLPCAPEGEEIVFDYASLGLTLRRHPLSLLRSKLDQQRLMSAETLRELAHGKLARACGIVTVRQQPPTAGGVVFVTLEDETGTVNVIVWKHLRDRQRQELLHSRLLAVYGVWQREGEVRHLIAHHLRDLTPLLGRLATESRDFH